ncbi:MAG TPA: ABC transporter permease [Candidatus Dormibacteraeota bacterium]|nr:ABC transporter permease [Candidatus Dormibacteraeota bacterium]
MAASTPNGIEEPGQARREAMALRRAAGSFLERRWASILVVAVALAAYFAVANPAFLSGNNLLTIASFLSETAIVTAGEVMVMICGEIDLSVGFVAAMAPFVMYFVWNDAGLPLWLGVVAGLIVSGIVGLVNGLVTVVLRVPSFVTTLGMSFLLNGLTLTTTGAFPIQAPEQGTRFAALMGHNQVAELGWAIAVVLIVQIGLSYTRWGLYTIATGGNLLGASEAGVNVRAIKIANFILCSVLGGLAGILLAFRVSSIDPSAGGYDIMFRAVSGAVIGGTALAGGSGTVIGGFIGALVLAILLDGFTLQGIQANTFDLILGAAILVAMILNVTLQGRRQQGGQ